MTWREDLRRVTIDGKQLVGASFRGVPFLVEASDRGGGGRRTVLHEFPFRDDPFIEDLGRRARSFRLDGYVIGDDYLVKRDALLSVLEDVAGPGELVHPYHGIRRAICTQLSVRDATQAGGMAVFSLEFAETPTQAPVPTEVVDSPAVVASRADVANVASRAELVERYSIAGLPAFALGSCETALINAAAGMQSRLAPVVSIAQELAVLTGQIRLITDRASSLVRAPGDAMDALLAAIAGLVDTAEASPGELATALMDAYGSDLGAAAAPTTTTRQREIANQAAFTGAIRRLFAVEAARLLPLVTFETLEAASAARDRLAGLLEQEAAVAGDTAYPSVVDLRSEVMRAVPGEQTFPRTTTIARSSPIPSLLLAYQLYGSVEREADIIARNHIQHPGFIAGDLEVIADV